MKPFKHTINCLGEDEIVLWHVVILSTLRRTHFVLSLLVVLPRVLFRQSSRSTSSTELRPRRGSGRSIAAISVGPLKAVGEGVVLP